MTSVAAWTIRVRQRLSFLFFQAGLFRLRDFPLPLWSLASTARTPFGGHNSCTGKAALLEHTPKKTLSAGNGIAFLTINHQIRKPAQCPLASQTSVHNRSSNRPPTSADFLPSVRGGCGPSCTDFLISLQLYANGRSPEA